MDTMRIGFLTQSLTRSVRWYAKRTSARVVGKDQMLPETRRSREEVGDTCIIP